MRSVILFVLGIIATATIATPAMAQSCYDLWYARNEIYDRNGYCFGTQLDANTFDNSDCWTNNPRLSRAEQRRVDQIRREERRRKCKVNN